MQVTMIAARYVGLVSGVCFVDFGQNVIWVESDAAQTEDDRYLFSCRMRDMIKLILK